MKKSRRTNKAGTKEGIMVLRRTRPDAERPYRTRGYPVTPILFILISLFFTLATLIAKPVQALAAFGCMV